jgi:lysozyme family protein
MTVMTNPREMAEALKRAKRVITNRLAETDNQGEIAAIEAQIDDLDRKIDKVTLLGLNQAAALVADAADGLLGVVRSARTGALDGYIQRIGSGIALIRVQIEEAVDQAGGQSRDFPKSEDPGVDRPLPAPNPAPAPPPDPVRPPAAIPAVVKSKKFADLKAEYEAEWANCEIRADKRSTVDTACVAKLNANRARYEQVARRFGNMPWYFVGIIHGMEAGFRFDRHLHNGDPLTARTVRVPRGRPAGNPPFTWEASAQDALADEGFGAVTDWSDPNLLYLWERYNGLGYRFKGLRTPYLWSYSNLYSKGRYVADGVFDPNAESKQCGAAVMLKALGR